MTKYVVVLYRNTNRVTMFIGSEFIHYDPVSRVTMFRGSEFIHYDPISRGSEYRLIHNF